MRVVYILNDSRPTNGANKAIFGLVSQLRQMGITPVWVIPIKPGPYEGLPIEGDEVLWLNYRPNIYPPLKSIKDALLYLPRIILQLVLNIKAIYQLVHYIYLHPADAIHSNVSVLSWGLLAARKLGLPHFTHVREHVVKEYGMQYFPSSKWVYKILNASGNYNICITRNILEHHHLAASESSVVYDGVCSAPPSMPREPKEDYFLFVGRIEYGKGADILLQGYEEYVKQNASPKRLLLAGEVTEPQFMEHLNHFIATHSLESHVQLLGLRHDVAELMQKAKALIVASRFEGFGFCLAEGMFNGCLCVGYDVSGTHEQMALGHDKMGAPIALSFNTPTELAAQLSTITSAPDSNWDDMRERAFRMVTSHYTHAASATKVMQIYTTHCPTPTSSPSI